MLGPITACGYQGQLTGAGDQAGTKRDWIIARIFSSVVAVA